jgi:hypothetical protein
MCVRGGMTTSLRAIPDFSLFGFNVVRVSTDDKIAHAVLSIQELIQCWGLFRDQHRWGELLETFASDGSIAVSWFRGSFGEFVERCRTRGAQVGSTKHLLSPSVVRVFGQRALAETSVMILVRQDIKGIATDLTAYARFLDRLEQSDWGTWTLVERTAVYERDRLDPVEPSVAFDALMQGADCGRYPAPYRYMAFRIAAAGGSLAMPVLYDGLPQTDALRARYRRWLAEAG